MPTADADAVAALVAGAHGAPFDLLGQHPYASEAETGLVIRTFQPQAASVAVVRGGEALAMTRTDPGGFFELTFAGATAPFPYQLAIRLPDGRAYTADDAYRFQPVLSEYDLYLFGEGSHQRLYDKLGAHPLRHEEVAGVVFAVWAPSAQRVSVVGDFNQWDGRRHPMRPRGASGLWELFIPGLAPGELYKYEIRSQAGGRLLTKSDPYGFAMELRPATASRVWDLEQYEWGDDEWLAGRAARQGLDAAVNIYEAHLGSWQRGEGGRWYSYRELAERLVPYARDMGYTHLELLPVAEHPLDGSWGYQVIGYFAPTARYGTPDDFRFFVDAAHQAGLGVILDWVPAHFPKDATGLAQFDGTHLYEHADPRKGEHQDWGTLIFNFGRTEVAAFLLTNALFWLDKYHIDGLRVDAVASMLYLDYSRQPGQWVPNEYGGRENLEAVQFLKRFNDRVHEQYPGVLTIAEESTAWPLVSRPTYLGGLGFSLKWNMGWMHDILDYMRKDPVYRRYHHNSLTFSLMYAFSENFVLPFSHDEVVHLKGSLLTKMPGDDWRRFANLRALLAYMTAHPGKKLLFMGGEFGQWREWDFGGELAWGLLEHPAHRKLQHFVRDLNHLYRREAALHQVDFSWEGFQWIDLRDVDQSAVSFLRRAASPTTGGEAEFVVVVANFTPVPREGYRVGVPRAGFYSEVLNSDAEAYGGSNMGNRGGLPADEIPWQDQPYSLLLTLPPLAVVFFKPEPLPAAALVEPTPAEPTAAEAAEAPPAS
ncbi:MAG: 1,4-alpha-glucan branching protein GlgB [Anaerolineales bacterium]|nr:1,4-alpha-glucan branching protein GlgB [Anaerolineales bacterium]